MFSPSSGSAGPHGAPPVLAPGPPPQQKEYYRITLKPTPEGFRAFKLKLKAKLGSNLKATLIAAFVNDDFDPTDMRTENMHQLIFDEMVKGMDGNDALMLRMTNACGEKGPKCLKWLQEQLDPEDTAHGLIAMMSIMTDPLGAEIVEGIEMKIDLNNSLPADLKITDKVLCALVLTQLPGDLRHIRDIIVQQDNLPTMEGLLKSVKNAVHFYKPQPVQTPANTYTMATPRYAGTKVCVNCNSMAHKRVDCKVAKADCAHCGEEAGHMTVHCFVSKTGALPSFLSKERQAEIMEKRAALKLKAPVVQAEAQTTAATTTLMVASGSRDYDSEAGGFAFTDFYNTVM
jgi:hypothetical protein